MCSTRPSAYYDRGTCGSLTVIGLIFATEGFPQFIEEFGVELVQRDLGSGFRSVQESWSLGIPVRTGEGNSGG